MHLLVAVRAIFSSADHTSDVVVGGLVWRTLHWSCTWEQGNEENEVNILYVFITAHYVGTTTLSDIQANMT